MSLIKKIKNKVLENYHSHRGYFFAKLSIIVLMLLVFIGSGLDVFSLIVDGAEMEGILSGLKKSLIIIFVRIILNGVIELIFFPSGKIKDNMDNLPNDVLGKKTLVQYNLQEKVTPSVAAMLLYGRSELSNLTCIIYQWINSKVVCSYNKDGNRYLKALHSLGEVPFYEEFLFRKMFWGDEGSNIVYDKNLLKKYKVIVNDMIVSYCEREGYILRIKNTVGYSSKVMGCLTFIITLIMMFICILSFCAGKFMIGILMLIICEIFGGIGNMIRNNAIELKKGKNNVSISFILFILWILCFIFFIAGEFLLGILVFIIILLIGDFKNKNETYDIKLTDKGKKMLSEIVGYKYYLEHCEEEQINSDLEEGEIYSKHLPYAIALKLNWKIIDELS